MSINEKQLDPRIYAGLAALALTGLIALYVFEFPHLRNTIQVRWLVWGSLGFGLLTACIILYSLRARLTPLENHLPEFFSIGIFTVIFMPLFVSLLNRLPGADGYQSFEFLSEKPYVRSAYGIFANEHIKPTHYQLDVRDQGKLLRFEYKKQAYFPLSKPGEVIMLPVRKGLLGFRIVQLQ